MRPPRLVGRARTSTPNDELDVPLAPPDQAWVSLPEAATSRIMELAPIAVLQGADRAQPGPPAMHPIIGHPDQTARPGVRGASGDRFVDQLEDRFLRLARDPCGQRAAQVQPCFPRSNANSIACALSASVSCASSPRAWSSSQFRSVAGRPGRADNAANAASLTVRRMR